MKKFISMAVTVSMLLTALVVKADSNVVKKDFENRVLNFGVAYSGRFDTKLPSIFLSSEEAYSGEISLEMIPTESLPYNKRVSGTYFAYQGVYCGDYIKTEDGKLCIASSNVMTNSSNVKMRYILMDGNDIITVSNEYELTPSVWLNAECEFEPVTDSEKGKIIIAFYSNIKNLGTPTIYIDDVVIRSSHIIPEKWNSNTGEISTNGSKAIFSNTAEKFSDNNELTYKLRKSELNDGINVFVGRITSNMTDTYVTLSLDELPDLCNNYQISAGEEAFISMNFDIADINTNELTVRLGISGKTNSEGTVTISECDVKDASYGISVDKDGNKLVIKGSLKNGNENIQISTESEMLGSISTTTDSTGSFRIEKLCSEINEPFGNIGIKFYGVKGYPREYVETQYYYISDSYKNEILDDVKDCENASQIAMVLTEEVLGNVGIFSDSIFREANLNEIFDLIVIDNISGYDELVNELFTAACATEAQDKTGGVYELVKKYEKYLIDDENQIYADLFNSASRTEFDKTYREYTTQVNNTDDFVDKISWTLIKNKVKNSNNYSEGMLLIKKYADILGLDMTQYKKIEGNSKGHTVATQFISYLKTGNDYQKVQNILDDLCKGNIVPGSSNGNGNTSSGGGSSSGGGVSRPSSSVGVVEYTPSSESEYRFSDLDSVVWAQESIYKLLEKNIISKNSEKLFYPRNKITRAEFAKMIAVMLKYVQYDGAEVFEDVKADSWYFEYVMALYERGIVKGISINEFSPDSHISRQDICVILSRALELTNGTDIGFSDSEKIAPYARDAVSQMKNAGYISGYEDNTFRPDAGATRAEVANMLGSIK